MPATLQRGLKMKRWRFKACPRCGGDVFLDDEYDNRLGWVRFEECLQCAWRRELGVGRVVALQPEDER